ncbi:MAG: 3-hydroxyacyl-CoA dehydrogenase NAD-binding domain-containing protein [Mariprofundaceae bacterium]|nr:3-hydroxyacyl-CoA dehydrogenase NAD-binding domain-containing protein [Mariprofundaceae bacterium]
MQTLSLIHGENFSRLIFDRDDKKLNVLDACCMQDLACLLDQLEENPPAILMIQSAKPHCFVAGADIDVIAAQEDEHQAKQLAERGQHLFRRLENLSTRTIAIVRGACLGGGLELALSCDDIIAVDCAATRLALPEIRLGIHPAFGGCVRLPKRIGWPKAVDMILSGRSLNAKKANKLGLVALCCDVSAIADAETFILKQKKTKKRATPLWYYVWPLRAFFFMQVRKRVLSKVAHVSDHAYPALKATLDLLQELYGMSDDLGFAKEAESLGKVAITSSCHRLIRTFKLGQALKNQYRKEKVDVTGIEDVAVYGAGVMGSGIAWLAAKKHHVDLHEVSDKILTLGMCQLDILAKLDASSLTNIRPSLHDNGLNQVQVVIEAVSENMALKQKLWQELEAKVSPDCLLLSNTSSLSITEMQSCLEHPKRMAGLHFFNPVHKMPLVEVIAGEQTDPEVIKQLCALMNGWGKYPLVVKDCPGFLVNRCLLPYIKAALDLLAQGQDAIHIDRCLKHFGMPMGVFELMDRIGIDICWHVGQQLGHDFPDWLEKMVQKGHLGAKTGKGFFLYRGKVQTTLNPVLHADITALATDDGWSCHRILDACLLPMLLEAWRCLDEDVVQCKDHLDAAMIYGIGFPPFHGGLLHYFEQQNREDLLQRMESLSLNIDQYRVAPPSA